MRHRKRTIKLGRTSSHREAMFANLVSSFIMEKRVTTTLAKAKAARSMAEKMVTLGKRDSVDARRKVAAKLHYRKPSNHEKGDPTPITVLFGEIAPGFTERDGGYTRITKVGRRSSDSSEMAILEWVEYGSVTKKKKSKKKAPKAKAKVEKEEAAEVEEPEVEETPAAEETPEEAVSAEEAPAEEVAVEEAPAEDVASDEAK